MLTDDIRHADPLLNSKVLISSEHSIPTSISLGNMQLSSLFNNYTVLSFRRGPRPARAHSIRCLSDHRSPARIALPDMHIHYGPLYVVHAAHIIAVSIFFCYQYLCYASYNASVHQSSEIPSHLVGCVTSRELTLYSKILISVKGNIFGISQNKIKQQCYFKFCAQYFFYIIRHLIIRIASRLCCL